MSKTLTLIGLVFLFSSAVKAQSKSVGDDNFSKENHAMQETTEVKIIPYVREYAFSDPKKLATHFKSEAIPVSFPKFNPSLSERENKIIAINWFSVDENRVLVKDESLIIVDEKISQIKRK